MSRDSSRIARRHVPKARIFSVRRRSARPLSDAEGKAGSRTISRPLLLASSIAGPSPWAKTRTRWPWSVSERARIMDETVLPPKRSAEYGKPTDNVRGTAASSALDATVDITLSTPTCLMRALRGVVAFDARIVVSEFAIPVFRVFLQIHHRQHDADDVAAGIDDMLQSAHGCVAAGIGPPNQENGLIGDANEHPRFRYGQERRGIEDDDIIGRPQLAEQLLHLVGGQQVRTGGPRPAGGDDIDARGRVMLNDGRQWRLILQVLDQTRLGGHAE